MIPKATMLAWLETCLSVIYIYIYLVIPARLRGAGANPRCPRARGEVRHEHVASPLEGTEKRTTTRTHT